MAKKKNNNNDEVVITITKAEYDQLLKDQNFLECLREAGVDNWEGYDEAVELFHEENEEEKSNG